MSATAKEFSEALRVVIADYLRHFEPTADPELYRIRLEATGPELNILYDRTVGQKPSITFTMHPEVEDEKGRRR